MTRREMFTFAVLLEKSYVKWFLNSLRMECKELRHDRHTVSLLTNPTVISPKYHGKILVEKTIALAVEEIIRKICRNENRNH